MKYSQSMLKELKLYLSAEFCGKLFFEKWYKESVESETTPAQAAGQWFEFMCTGATPRNSGVDPVPVELKKGGLNAMYSILNDHVSNWNKIKPIEETNVGAVLNAWLEGRQLTGIADVMTHDEIVDIKTTAFIDNKWEQYGWGGDLTYKPALFQAKFYTLLHYINTEIILPFRFAIFASNSDKFKQVQVLMTEESLNEFKDEVIKLIELAELHNDLGYETIARYDLCKGCPLFKNCAERVEVPEVEIYKL